MLKCLKQWMYLDQNIKFHLEIYFGVALISIFLLVQVINNVEKMLKLML